VNILDQTDEDISIFIVCFECL